MIHYESDKILKIKAQNGFESAKVELTLRKRSRCTTGLKGITEEDIIYTTVNLYDRIETIKALYNKLNLSPKTAYQDIMLIDSYFSATIEGAKTTVDHVKKAIENKKATKDEKMVVNSLCGFNYALNHELNIDNLLQLWRIVTDGVCDNYDQAGERFRKGMVCIGDNTKTVHTPERPDKIESRMVDLYTFIGQSDLDAFLKAAIVHFYFVYVHPFCDGNGRTARILMSSFLVKEGYEKIKAVPISVSINDNLSGYYKSLVESEETQTDKDKRMIDISPFIFYILNMIEQSLISALAAQNTLNEVESLLLTKMKKVKGAEITAEKCSKILKTDEQDAANILYSLTEKGYLEKISNGSCYKLIV